MKEREEALEALEEAAKMPRDLDELEQAALDYAKAYGWTSPIEQEVMRRTLAEQREQLKLARTLLELHEREVPLAVRRKLIEALDPTEQTSRIEALAHLKLKP